MPGKVVQLKTLGTVSFFKNRRSKNIKISVKPDKSVLVSYPFYCTSGEVLDFIRKNENWIKIQQQKMELRKTKIESSTVLKTKLYSVHFLHGEKFDVDTKGFQVTITVKNFTSKQSQDFIENILTQIYRYEARKLLPGRLSELAAKHGFSYGKVTIRNNKRNWGSCSSNNNISLNLQMMKLPDELIDYILLHELVHTEIKNHSEKFWLRLNQLTDNKARELSKKTRSYSTYTL